MTSRTGILRAGRRRLAVAVLTGVVAAVSITGAAPAAAHDSLVGADPADGSTQATVPATVTLRFEEPPATLGIAVAVLGPTGEVAFGTPSLVGSSVSVALRPGSPAGSYRVSWRVTSDDGHPVQGTTRFTARAGSTAAVTPTAAPTAPTPTNRTALPATPATESSTAQAVSTVKPTPSTDPAAAGPSVAQVPAAAPDAASGRGTTVVVVLGLVVLAAIGTAVVSRRRAR